MATPCLWGGVPPLSPCWVGASCVATAMALAPSPPHGIPSPASLQPPATYRGRAAKRAAQLEVPETQEKGPTATAVMAKACSSLWHFVTNLCTNKTISMTILVGIVTE